MVLTWCLLASAASCRDGQQAGWNCGSRIGDTLDPRPLEHGLA
jgi:hypothetical protein